MQLSVPNASLWAKLLEIFFFFFFLLAHGFSVEK